MNSIISLNLTRSMYSKKNTDKHASNLQTLLSDAKAVKNNEGLLYVTLQGWEADERSDWNIPEVREWMAELDKVFPYWFHFCEKKFDSLGV